MIEYCLDRLPTPTPSRAEQGPKLIEHRDTTTEAANSSTSSLPRHAFSSNAAQSSLPLPIQRAPNTATQYDGSLVAPVGGNEDEMVVDTTTPAATRTPLIGGATAEQDVAELRYLPSRPQKRPG